MEKFGTREQPRIASHRGILAVMRPCFVIFLAILAIFDTDLKPQKCSVEFISGKWKSLELTNSLLLPHMEGYWQL